MTHMTTPPTSAALQQQMLDLIEELRTIPSHRRQQRCLVQLEVLRYQLHGHPDLLEKLASLLAVTGQALQDPAYSVVMRLAAVTATDWLVGVARVGHDDPQQLAAKIDQLLHSGVAGLWCINGVGDGFRPLCLCSGDLAGDRHAEAGHAVVRTDDVG
jgi:hypothetical protein